jgi:predicted Kef-type K+ transport protein
MHTMASFVLPFVDVLIDSSINESHEWLCRVLLSLAATVAAAIAIARTVLPSMAKMLAKHATTELFQLTLIAFCLVGSFISGRLVSTQPTTPRNICL